MPTDLIVKISKLHRGGTFKAISNLHKHKLVYHENKIYDGYRLTYLGYDFLCCKAMSMRGLVVSVGTKIGVGKESDIYACAGPNDEALVLKLARLGRISFRSIKTKRDYMLKRKSASWLYMSRLAAFREYSYMKVLAEHGLPIPKPVDWSRHGVLMERVDGINLSTVNEIDKPKVMYDALMDIILQFASFGLIHCDFNEFNLMVNKETGKITVIDFPQMVSISHFNAQWYFERDVECVVTFFSRKMGYESETRARWADVTPGSVRLDVLVKASGVNSSVGMPNQKMGDEDETEGDIDQEIPEEKPEEPEVGNANNNNNDVVDVAADLAVVDIPVNDNDDEEEKGRGGSAQEEEEEAGGEGKSGKADQSTEDRIRANVRKEIRKGRQQKVFKSSKRQGKRETQRQGARKVKEEMGGGSGGGW